MSRASTFDPYSAYPPSPSSRNPRQPLRVNTQTASIRSSGVQSPSRGGFQTPLYDLPPNVESPTVQQNRARPGGLAGIASSSSVVHSAHEERRVKSPPGTPGGMRALQYRQQNPQRSRRSSIETNVAPNMVPRRSSENALPGMSRREGSRSRASPVPVASGSVFSGREGSVYRPEGVASPSPVELQLFAHHCRLFYFSPNPAPDSATFISTTLASLPPSHRAAYTRLQSSLRSLAHLHHLKVRVTSFHALISSTVASASLTPLARSDLSSKRAVEERRERFARFIGTWCTSSAGGVEPFFRGLWAAMRVQSRGEEARGGAGGRRVVWEIDDAVFLESGGAEFMHETVMILKGVLGFTDQPLTSPPRLRRVRTIPRTFEPKRPGFTKSGSNSPRRALSSYTDQQELLADVKPPLPSRRTNSSSTTTISKEPSRSRAISDPFSDPSASPRKRTPSGRGPAPPPPPSRKFHAPSPRPGVIPNPLQIAESDPVTPGYNVEAPLLPNPSAIVSALEAAAEDQEHLLSSRTMSGSTQASGSGMLYRSGVEDIEEEAITFDEEEEPTEDEIHAEEVELNKPRFRLWTFPAHITDQEISSLLSTFPSFITKRKPSSTTPSDPRFPYLRPGRGLTDLEAGGGGDGWDKVVVEEGREVKVPKLEVEDLEGVLRFGTGRMWVGMEGRRAGWRGSGWFRFTRWWKRLFGGG